MSAYIYFFARKDDTFVELGCTSRNSDLFKAFDGVTVYEKTVELDKEDFNNVKDQLLDSFHQSEEMIARYEAELAAIPTFNNEAEEKLQLMSEVRNELESAKEEKSDVDYALYYLGFLRQIYDNYELNRKYEGVSYKGGVYVGYEDSEPVLGESVIEKK